MEWPDWQGRGTGEGGRHARTSVEEQEDSGLRGGGRDVNGLGAEVATQIRVAMVVVPLQPPVLHRRLVVFLRAHRVIFPSAPGSNQKMQGAFPASD